MRTDGGGRREGGREGGRNARLATLDDGEVRTLERHFRGLGQRLKGASRFGMCVCRARGTAPYDGVAPRLHEQRAAVLVERHAGCALRHAVHHPPRLRGAGAAGRWAPGQSRITHKREEKGVPLLSIYEEKETSDAMGGGRGLGRGMRSERGGAAVPGDGSGGI